MEVILIVCVFSLLWSLHHGTHMHTTTKEDLHQKVIGNYLTFQRGYIIINMSCNNLYDVSTISK